MAQRGTGFARKPPAVEAPRVEAPPRPLPEETVPPDPIPIDLAPLVAPYRRHGRLTVRVERMPTRARLSRGHINSDRSWSLALDELDGLTYMPASAMDAATTLAVRVIRLDGGDGGTIALLEYPVVPEESAESADTAIDGSELRGLREELAKLKTSLAIRDAELARVKQNAGPEKIELPRETIDAELAALRESWEAEAEARIAAAVKEATATMSKLRGAARASDDARLAKIEKSAEDRLSQERERWEKDADAALTKAEKDWKDAEAARLAAAEAAWQKRSEKAFAEAAAQLEKTKIPPQGETARARADEAEKRKLRDDLAKAKATLAERDADLAREKSNAKQTQDAAGKLKDADGERERLRTDLANAKAALAEREAEHERERSNVRETRFEAGKLRDADTERQHLRNELARSKSLLAERERDLKQAQDDAKAKGEAAYLASTRAVGELEKAKAQLAAREEELNRLRSGAETARSEADTLRSDSAELKRVRGELATRDAELARLRKENKDALRQAERESDRALKDAEKRWQDAEAERLVAAEEKWRTRSNEDVARVTTELRELEGRAREDAAHHKGREDILAESRDAQAALKKLLASRDEDVVRLKAEHEQARERWAQETETALSNAQQAWKVAEASRTSALEGQWQENAAAALRDMTTRAKKAESVLAETRTQMEALRHRGDTADFLRLRKELNSVQGQLARRDAELTQLRSDHELERERLATQARAAVQKADQQWRQEDEEPEERGARAQATWHLIRNLLVAAVFGGLAMVGYYKVAPMITSTGVLDPILPQSSVGQTSTATTLAAQKPVLTVLRSAKLRAGPSTTAAAIGSLPANAQVVELDRKDKWVRVDAPAKSNAKPQQGWVYGSVLSKPVAATQSPSKVTKK